MIYIDISSQKKPSYGGSKNWVIMQDCDTQKWYFSMNTKEYPYEHFIPFLNKIKTTKKNVIKICCDNAGENKIIEENCLKNFEEIKF